MERKNGTAIFFHADTDGCVSAANILGAIGGRAGLFPLSNPAELSGRLAAKAKGKFDKIYILDLGTAEKKAVRGTGADVIVIDHHEGKPIVGKGILHLNPIFSGMPPYPVSYSTYLLFGGKDWQAFTGVVADWCVALLPDFMNAIWQRYGWRGSQEELYFHSDAGTILSAIDAAASVMGEKGALKAVAVLRECKTPQEFLAGKGGASELLACLGKIEAEIGRVLETAERDEEGKGLVVMRFSSKYRIKSQVIQRLRMANPAKAVFVFQRAPGGWRFSARAQDALRLSEPFGHGHQAAVGGFVPSKNLDGFVKGIKSRIA